jgi:hypothetical protein
MGGVQWFSQVADVPEIRWGGRADVPVDQSKQFRQFREIVESSESFALVTEGPGAALIASGYVTSRDTGLFSDPWKLWCDDQFLRLDDLSKNSEGAAPGLAASGTEIVALRDSLVRRLAGNDADTAPVDAGTLHDRLGGCLVVRGFDSSELSVGGAGIVAGGEAGRVLAALQSAASRRGLGVAFPYVDRGDAELVDVLHRAGYMCGAVTATTIFDLPAWESLDDLLLRVPSRVRRRFRKEWTDFTAAGYTLHELDLMDDLHEIVSLETRNRVKHGGWANTERLTDLRLAMARLLGGNVRVLGARDASGNLVACGIDVVDDRRYLSLAYGQDDDSVTEVVYPVVGYFGPLSYALERGIPSLRMGFEAFLPKAIRGARAEKRLFAFWHPDDDVRAAAGELLTLFDERLEAGVLSRTRTLESSGDRWSFIEAASLPARAAAENGLPIGSAAGKTTGIPGPMAQPASQPMLTKLQQSGE